MCPTSHSSLERQSRSQSHVSLTFLLGTAPAVSLPRVHQAPLPDTHTRGHEALFSSRCCPVHSLPPPCLCWNATSCLRPSSILCAVSVISFHNMHRLLTQRPSSWPMFTEQSSSLSPASTINTRELGDYVHQFIRGRDCCEGVGQHYRASEGINLSV